MVFRVNITSNAETVTIIALYHIEHHRPRAELGYICQLAHMFGGADTGAIGEFRQSKCTRKCDAFHFNITWRFVVAMRWGLLRLSEQTRDDRAAEADDDLWGETL